MYYAGPQVTQWDFQTKESKVGLDFVLEVSLYNLRPTISNFPTM